MNAEEIRKEFNSLKNFGPGEEGPWVEFRAALRQHVDRDDFSHFMQWSTIRATMYVGNDPYLRREYEEMPQGVVELVTKATPFGAPEFFERNTRLETNLIHQLYHVHVWERFSGRPVHAVESILEIGGGYGALALVVRRLGYFGPYTIVDFPEFGILQRHYILEAYGRRALDGMLFLTAPPLESPDLIFAVASVSEMAREVRRPFEIMPNVGGVWYFQNAHSGVDNLEYFEWWAKQLQERGFRTVRIPTPVGSHYLLATK